MTHVHLSKFTHFSVLFFFSQNNDNLLTLRFTCVTFIFHFFFILSVFWPQIVSYLFFLFKIPVLENIRRYCQQCYTALWKDAKRVVDLCAKQRKPLWLTNNREEDLERFIQGMDDWVCVCVCVCVCVFVCMCVQLFTAFTQQTHTHTHTHTYTHTRSLFLSLFSLNQSLTIHLSLPAHTHTLIHFSHKRRESTTIDQLCITFPFTHTAESSAVGKICPTHSCSPSLTQSTYSLYSHNRISRGGQDLSNAQLLATTHSIHLLTPLTQHNQRRWASCVLRTAALHHSHVHFTHK